MQKITLEVPRELLKQAQRATGQGISATVRTGLQRLAAQDAYRILLESRGKWKTGVSWQKLKDDR